MGDLYIVLIILGIVQGIAEFLPISSSGHLVIIEQISYFKNTLDVFGKEVNLFVNVTFHIATLVAVVIYLWKDIIWIIKGFFTGIFSKNFDKPEVKVALNVIIASIPAGIIGILFNDFFEELFSTAKPALIFLIINGIILISTKRIPVKNRKIEEIGLFRSTIIGFFQAFAILPGISRSGMTITGGMYNGLIPEESAKFSFLMAIPVIAGAGLIEGIKAAQGNFPVSLYIPLGIASIITIIVALISLKLLFILVKRIKLDLFGYYTIAAGITGLIILYLSK